jgi:2-octaprenyl-6-methoxyphenol hydroxylase
MALALSRLGVRCEIYDSRHRGAAAGDTRILALSHGARQILEWLGVWQGVANTPIETIHISQQRGLGITRIRASEENVPALGYVIGAGDLAATLDTRIGRAAIPFHEHAHIEPDRPPAAILTIWAEGAADAESAVCRDYGQQAVVCTATAKEAHGNRAWERFTPEGPVAILPLGRDYTVVLTVAAAEAHTVADLDDLAFLDRLQSRFGNRLQFTGVGSRHVFPLALRYRPSLIGDRRVWIGNAAQTLHPVAGQGFNLALRDIHQLAHAIAQADDPGAPEALAAYAHGRRLDRKGVMVFTDLLVRLFGNDNPLLRHVRGAGLLALDLLPPARSFVARRMMLGARGW